MKKGIKITLKVLGGIILFLLLAILIIPFIFEDKIAGKALEVANKNVNAEISMEDINLTLYRHFPDFTLELNNLSVKNIDNFEGVELANIERFEIILGLGDVLSGNLKIKTIGIVEPKFNVIVDSLGKANYDIAKESTSTENIEEETMEEEIVEGEEKEGSDFKVLLEEFFIKNANISYEDKKGGMKMVITNFNHRTTGDFSLDNLIAETKTSIEDIYFAQGGVTLLKETSFYANLNADIDNKNKIYKVTENEIGLNEIKFLFEGSVKMLENEPMDIDLKFNTKEVKFKDLLSMIPGAFRHHIKGLKTSGKFEIGGNVKGKFKDSLMPSFGISLLVKDGFIQYPDVPKPIQNIDINVRVNRKQGIGLDNIIVDLDNFSMDFGGNPIKMDAHIKTPISDPNLSSNIVANIDLSKVKDVVPLDKKDDLKGKIISDIHLKGKMSYIDKKQFEKFYAKGNLNLFNVVYSSESLPFKKVNVNKLLFDFSPYTLNLSKLDISIGKSDINMNGKIHNYLGYVMKNQTLSGNLNVNSKNLFLDEIAGEEDKEGSKKEKKQEVKKEEKGEEKKMEAILLPKNIKFNTNLNLAKVEYGDIKMRNVKGKLGINKEVAYMDKIGLTLLEGRVILDGHYSTKNNNVPKADMDLKILKLDIETTIQTFPSISKIAPQVADVKGKFSSNLELKTSLTKNMEPNYKTLYSDGNIKTYGINMKTIGALKKLGDALKSKSLQNPKMKDLDIKYKVEKGVLYVSPIVIEAGNIKGTIGGKTYIETQTIDMIGQFTIPRKEIGGANKVIDEAVNLAKKNKIKVSVSDKLNVKVKIQGPAKSPKYNILYGPKEAPTIGKYVSYEVDTIKEKVKKEGVNKAKKEAKKLYDKNKDEIKNKLKGLFR